MSTKIEGKYTSANVYRDDIEQYAEAQIKMLCDMEIHKDFYISIMPDVHPGKVGPIGLVMTTKYDKDKTCLMPALVGNDIGCGVKCVKIELPKRQKYIDYDRLTKAIDTIFYGAETFNKFELEAYGINSKRFFTYGISYPKCITEDDIMKSLGTLGSGNHFIELDTYAGEIYMIIHTGSRSVGNRIYEYYMKLARENSPKDTPYELSYLSGELLEKYLEDVSFATMFAYQNRDIILNMICKFMNWSYTPNTEIDNIHNDCIIYEDKLILTKGANCVLPESKVCIPINSVDGCIIGQVTNQSSDIVFTPHGSGRKIKRTEVANSHTVNEYKKLMKTHNVACNTFKGTLDESPFAYRGLDDILLYLNLEDYIVTIPIYNYKSGDKK